MLFCPCRGSDHVAWYRTDLQRLFLGRACMVFAVSLDGRRLFKEINRRKNANMVAAADGITEAWEAANHEEPSYLPSPPEIPMTALQWSQGKNGNLLAHVRIAGVDFHLEASPRDHVTIINEKPYEITAYPFSSRPF